MGPAAPAPMTPVTRMASVVTMVWPGVPPGGLAVPPLVTRGHLAPRTPVTVHRPPTGPDLGGGELSLPLRPDGTLPAPAAG